MTQAASVRIVHPVSGTDLTVNYLTREPSDPPVVGGYNPIGTATATGTFNNQAGRSSDYVILQERDTRRVTTGSPPYDHTNPTPPDWLNPQYGWIEIHCHFQPVGPEDVYRPYFSLYRQPANSCNTTDGRQDAFTRVNWWRSVAEGRIGQDLDYDNPTGLSLTWS